MGPSARTPVNDSASACGWFECVMKCYWSSPHSDPATLSYCSSQWSFSTLSSVTHLSAHCCGWVRTTCHHHPLTHTDAQIQNWHETQLHLKENCVAQVGVPSAGEEKQKSCSCIISSPHHRSWWVLSTSISPSLNTKHPASVFWCDYDYSFFYDNNKKNQFILDLFLSCFPRLFSLPEASGCNSSQPLNSFEGAAQNADGLVISNKISKITFLKVQKLFYMQL